MSCFLARTFLFFPLSCWLALSARSSALFFSLLAPFPQCGAARRTRPPEAPARQVALSRDREREKWTRTKGLFFCPPLPTRSLVNFGKGSGADHDKGGSGPVAPAAARQTQREKSAHTNKDPCPTVNRWGTLDAKSGLRRVAHACIGQSFFPHFIPDYASPYLGARWRIHAETVSTGARSNTRAS